MKAAYGANYRQRPYEATAPQYKVSATRKFTFDLKTSVDFERVTATGEKRPAAETALRDVAQVFSDPTLQSPVPAQVRQAPGKTDQVIVSPGTGGIYADNHTYDAAAAAAGASQSMVELATPGKWSGFTRYYLARYIGADGKKLARPVVTMFTVKGASFALKAPTEIHASVNAGGLLQIDWAPVKGATAYQLVIEQEHVARQDPVTQTNTNDVTVVTHDSDATDRRLLFSVLERKGGTGLNITDSSLLDGTYSISEDQIAQNRATVEDYDGVNLYGLDVKAFSTTGNGGVSIAVVALNATARSPLEFVSITPLLSQIPLQPADFAQQQLKTKASTGRQAQAASASASAMTMADGSTAVIEEGSGKPVRYTYPKSSIDWSAYEEPQPKTTMALVPYPVNGSTELVKFLASNLMAGNDYLDVSAYLKATDTDEAALEDALDEAAAQNPYILYDNLYPEIVERDGKTLVSISTFYQIKDCATLRSQLWAKVQAVDAHIITSGMSNEAKARAINAWLISHASYDRAAVNASIKYQKGGNWDVEVATGYYNRFAYAQNATGVLLKGKGVCASYAAAFKALADRAGLPCVYVTGQVKSTGESHAWNKVDLGGRWLIVDSAWSDEAGSLTAYFGLTDASKRADRTQDKSFMVDKYIPQYAN
ncbi:MAG: hypothetical protein FWF45_06700 [Coriobacteriia bacterium]|nr:hypothetical protein [Coriobacteriia bacterium]